MDLVQRGFVSAFVIGGRRAGEYTDYFTHAIYDEKHCSGTVRQYAPLPTRLMYHSALIIRGKIVVTGGQCGGRMIEMGMNSQPPCQQMCYGFNLKTSRWEDLPQLRNAGGMHATLISVENRYVYQIGGSNPSCFNVVRLDFQNLSRGWQLYEVRKTFTKVPRHFLDKESRQ